MKETKSWVKISARRKRSVYMQKESTVGEEKEGDEEAEHVVEVERGKGVEDGVYNLVEGGEFESRQ